MNSIYEPAIIGESRTNKRNPFKWVLLLLISIPVLLLLVAFVSYHALNKPAFTGEFPINISIEEGESVPIIAQKLEDASVIQSRQLLYLILVTQFDPTSIKASRYLFDEPLTTYEVAERLIAGDFDTDLITVTIYEGESRRKMATRLATEHAWFDEQEFLNLTENLEGELFPDTYFVPPTFTTHELVELLIATYTEVLREYQSEIEALNLTEDNVVTLASIVEREANTPESMKYVSGILQNRLEIGMALQADATIEYALEVDLKDLPPGQLAERLRETDSVYNTYLYPGLPPTPIGNPGRQAIDAVLHPIESEYLYYITDDKGKFYYATTYEQHLKNIQLHLR